MSAIDSSRSRRILAIAWPVFVVTDLLLVFAIAGDTTLPDQLIWASFALVYGLVSWSRLTTTLTFWGTAIATSLPMILHAEAGSSRWPELSEIAGTLVLVYLLIWHVNRQRAAQREILDLGVTERSRAAHQVLNMRFGSHEIRTRLSVARGFVELIRDSSRHDDTRADAQLVIDELDKAAALNSQLLTLVQVELQTVPPPVEYQFDEVVEALLHRWSPTADRAWSCATSVGVISGHPERLGTALDCLVENAVKFTDDGDSIGVQGWIDGEEVMLSVTDSGVGIPQHDLEGIFDTFRTGSGAGERGGSGLGLAIVAAVVESLGGSVTVASAVGSGARFTIRCPRSGLDRNPERVAPDDTAYPEATREPLISA